ncbi:hypothetical protein GMRT_11053 [Giardia muris]|uniref:Uncharacterized protein n=1 Tax=Giardia muris TaxID=5742 RepID=A0A4Z1SU70_GIAMU|nr:hypothetical protein GMRT_11053 [Giardia muris]|eukprot:TNJ27158.1 hypothetical protein GMRT_11053 [Giardia muris]
MLGPLEAAQLITHQARGFVSRLVFLRIRFCLQELLDIPRIEQIIDSTATPDVSLILKLQGPEFPPRVVYTFRAREGIPQVRLGSRELRSARYFLTGSSSKVRGKDALPRTFTPRTTGAIHYRELFTYDKASRRYLPSIQIITGSPEYFALERALLPCSQPIVPRPRLTAAKALRARQLRTMFGIATRSADGRKALHTSQRNRLEDSDGSGNTSLEGFCDQLDATHDEWDVLSPPELPPDCDLGLRCSPSTITPPILSPHQWAILPHPGSRSPDEQLNAFLDLDDREEVLREIEALLE